MNAFPLATPFMIHFPPGRRSDSISLDWYVPSAPHHLRRSCGSAIASKIRSADPLTVTSSTIVSLVVVGFIFFPFFGSLFLQRTVLGCSGSPSKAFDNLLASRLRL